MSDKEANKPAEAVVVECIICLGKIESSDPIWHCVYCHKLSHLHCARRWYMEDDYPRTTCLCCRATLVNVPDKTPCLCGRVANDRLVYTNGCGRVCGKMTGDCHHLCQALCHPGKCTPCSITAEVSCPCGRKTSTMKCPVETTTCEQQCGKQLPCKHKCKNTCHHGPCKPCPGVTSVTCNCGRTKFQTPCNQEGEKPTFTCTKICREPLDCGKHLCREKCHDHSKNKDDCQKCNGK